jgi:hypothetical protein
MTEWVHFFRIVTSHRTGYFARLDPKIVPHFDDDHISQMARRLYMVPLPDGHPIGLTAQAEEWIARPVA